MANEEIILQIFFITVGIFFFSMILNKVLGLSPEFMRKFKEKSLNLQERMKNAETFGDQRMMKELQVETIQLMKEMTKKQLIPMTFRCFIFIGILFVLGLIYADYETGLLPFPILIFGDGWFAIYFLFAISLSLIMLVIKLAYRKITGKEKKKKGFSREVMQMMGPTQPGGLFQSPMQGAMQLGDQSNFHPAQPVQSDFEPISASSEPVSSWKDRLERSEPETSWKDRLERSESLKPNIDDKKTDA